MVTVVLRQLWLNDAADTSVALALTMLAGSSETWPSTATAVQYAAGRVRAGGGPRGARVWTPQLDLMPLAAARWLQERAGRVHWARDLVGGKVACFWDDAPITWQGPLGASGEHLAGVTLTLKAITHAEVPA